MGTVDLYPKTMVGNYFSEISPFSADPSLIQIIFCAKIVVVSDYDNFLTSSSPTDWNLEKQSSGQMFVTKLGLLNATSYVFFLPP